jgi:hypothetical protein
MDGPIDPRILDGEAVWLEWWSGLRWSDRRRIKGAIARGLAATDPMHAALAVGLVRRTLAFQHTGPLAAAIRDDGADIYEQQLHNAEESNLAVVRAWLEENA